MAKSKISDAEAEVIKDAIIDALEMNDETTENIEVVTPEVVIPEVVVPVAGHYSRDFSV